MTIPSNNSLGLFNDPYFLDGYGNVPGWFGYWYTTTYLPDNKSKDPVARSLLDSYIKDYQQITNYKVLKSTGAINVYEQYEYDLTYREYFEGQVIRFIAHDYILDNSSLKLTSIENPTSGYPLTKLKISLCGTLDVTQIKKEDIELGKPYKAVLVKNGLNNSQPLIFNNSSTYNEFYWIALDAESLQDLINLIQYMIDKSMDDALVDLNTLLTNALSKFNADLKSTLDGFNTCIANGINSITKDLDNKNNVKDSAISDCTSQGEPIKRNNNTSKLLEMNLSK